MDSDSHETLLLLVPWRVYRRPGTTTQRLFKQISCKSEYRISANTHGPLPQSSAQLLITIPFMSNTVSKYSAII